jgi:hypothetical protein
MIAASTLVELGPLEARPFGTEKGLVVEGLAEHTGVSSSCTMIVFTVGIWSRTRAKSGANDASTITT